jgi:hypothetical protein
MKKRGRLAGGPAADQGVRPTSAAKPGCYNRVVTITRIVVPALALTLLLPAAPAQSRVAVTFTGGYETDPRYGGRPDVLIAAALNVPTEVFRKAFSGVTPARGGQAPEPEQVRRNKQALMSSLGPYGVTNELLDKVTTYYRYNRSGGEMWRNIPAVAYATVRDGVVTGFTITNPGSGYSSPPKVAIPGMNDLKVTATLSFGVDLAKNGSIQEITVK